MRPAYRKSNRTSVLVALVVFLSIVFFICAVGDDIFNRLGSWEDAAGEQLEEPEGPPADAPGGQEGFTAWEDENGLEEGSGDISGNGADPEDEESDSEESAGEAAYAGGSGEVPEPKEPEGPAGPELKVISDGDYLLSLVTKETTLKSSYAPADLVQIPSYMNPPRTLYLRKEAFQFLVEMWEAAASDGVILSVLSTYRSYSYQADLFNSYAARHGVEAANRFSARAGQSEHQLGTTIDFGGTSVDWEAAFASTAQGKWLADNAHLYGFALSYPEGKEHITGYIYEPWHYRYIGVSSALEWKESGLVLCEFLKTKPQYFDN